MGTRNADREFLSIFKNKVAITNHCIKFKECAKRWQHSLNPELDRQPWQEAEVRNVVHILRQ